MNNVFIICGINKFFPTLNDAKEYVKSNYRKKIKYLDHDNIWHSIDGQMIRRTPFIVSEKGRIKFCETVNC